MLTVMVNFNESSHEVKEDDDALVISMVLSQPSSMPIQVEISALDVTATGSFTKS